MGAWGAGLFANDLSSDVKATFKEIVRLPLSEAQLVEAMLEEFSSGRDDRDEEYTDFWLSLADLFHAYAIESPDVFDRANGIIASGVDLETKRALEMSESDLRKRGKILDGLPSKWATETERPKPRRVMKAPEPLRFKAGDCVVFPTDHGNGAPTFMSAADLALNFSADGWGAFVVLATALRHGYWACYLIGVLYLETRDKPTLDQCRSAVFSGIDVGVPGFPNDAAIKTVTISKAEARKMDLESIGVLDLDQSALRVEFADRYSLVDDPYWSLAGLLRPYGDGSSLLPERPKKMKKLPLTRFLM